MENRIGNDEKKKEERDGMEISGTGSSWSTSRVLRLSVVETCQQYFAGT